MQGFWLWVLVNLAAWLVAGGLAAHGLGASVRLRQRPALILVPLAFWPFLPTILVGQFSGLLGLGVVALWLAARRDRALLAAGLIGALVAVKPLLLPLAALVLARPAWRPLCALAGGALAVSVPPALAFGPGVFAGWLGAVRAIHWYDSPFNAAPVGLLARHLPAFAPVAATIAPQVGLAAGLLVARCAGLDVDARVALLTTFGLLCSPLAWDHYALILLPALAAAVMQRRTWHEARRWMSGAAAVLLLLVALLYELELPVHPPLAVGDIMLAAFALIALAFTPVPTPCAPPRHEPRPVPSQPGP